MKLLRIHLPVFLLYELDIPRGSIDKQQRSVKKQIRFSVQEHHLSPLQLLQVQGVTARCEEADASQWISVVKTLSHEEFRCAMNAIQDTLPTRLNLQIWKRSRHNDCGLCNEVQVLSRVLNTSRVLLKKSLCKSRHNKVLAVFYSFIRQHLSNEYNTIVDLQGQSYIFPSDIAVTSLRSDIVVRLKRIWPLELSVVLKQSALTQTKGKKIDIVR